MSPRSESATAWHHPACQDDQALLAQCALHKSRTTGPGGQHRNKVETAVNLHHLPSGVLAQASERRSVTDNKRVALRRLRLQLAMDVRCPVPVGEIGSSLWSSRRRGPAKPVQEASDPVLDALGVKLRPGAALAAIGAGPKGAPAGRISCSPDHSDYPSLLAEALDVIADARWDHRKAAVRLGVSASQLLKLVKDYPPALVKMNAERAKVGERPLK